MILFNWILGYENEILRAFYKIAVEKILFSKIQDGKRGRNDAGILLNDSGT